MSVGNNASSLGAQAEYIRRELPLLTLESSVLDRRIDTRTDVKPVSTRPSRIPFQPLTQGGMRVGQFDGADLGLGSAPVETFGSLSCVGLLQPSQYTFLADWANDETSKSVENFVSLTHTQAPKVFAGFKDSLICNSAGANELDSVVSTTTNGIVVNNANSFQDQQPIDIWTGLNGTLRGSAIIQSVDIANNTIWLTGAIPAGTIAGDVIFASGSSATSNSGIFGLPYYNTGGNTGNYMGIQRSTFPGKFSTPTQDQGGKAMTPASVRALFSNIYLAMGEERANGAELVAHGNFDAQAAWENVALNVQNIVMNQVKGDQITDMLTKYGPKVVAGREFLMNPRAKPGRIDFLPLKYWWRLEIRKEDYIEVEGQTAFPAYGASGGIASSVLFYLAWIGQYGSSEPRLNAVYKNFSIPSGFFGH